MVDYPRSTGKVVFSQGEDAINNALSLVLVGVGATSVVSNALKPALIFSGFFCHILSYIVYWWSNERSINCI
ncbi:hypothetical protein [Photorhabdus akhurstii]|uniref:hypothetical protein n=1 Tax=Photorhabdus akhurstii TaxID=171438 RepID=UPI001BD54F8E|nr:hypothetical protein [Photorhabdus akhurstii]MBS9430078.1 hypothetical protein [Photorhabdus akhurstii]